MQFITVEVFINLCFIMFDDRALFVCVTDGTCLRIAIPSYCFIICRSIFGFLFCLLDRKLISQINPSDQV